MLTSALLTQKLDVDNDNDKVSDEINKYNLLQNL